MDNAQVWEAEVGHGTGSRADIERIAAVDEDDAEAILFRQGEH